MNYQPIFDQIDALVPHYLTIWQECCAIESPSDYKPGVDAVGQYFIDIARRHGWQVDVCEQPVSGNAVCITMNPQADVVPLSISGHMDTVHPVGLFGNAPVRIEDDKIYGPGVADCKGGIVAGILAMHALQSCGYNKRPIQLLLQSDEEVNSTPSKKGTIQYICEKAHGSVAFLNLESVISPKICLTRKGIINYRFTITGQSAHAGRCATEGASAIAEAAHKILALEKLKDATGVTCNCGIVQGGTATNTVPESCTILANVRFANRQQQEWAQTHVQQIADETHIPGCSCDLTIMGLRVAMEREERNIALYHRLNDIWADAGLARLPSFDSTGGSDAADVTACGIPCVDDVGVTGGGFHTLREYADIPSLAASAKRIAAAAFSL